MRKNVNKSALIKELFAKNPNWKASEIAAQMKKDGTPVSLPLVLPSDPKEWINQDQVGWKETWT